MNEVQTLAVKSVPQGGTLVCIPLAWRLLHDKTMAEVTGAVERDRHPVCKPKRVLRKSTGNSGAGE